MTAEERAKQTAWSLIDQPAANGNSAVAELHDRERAERIIAAGIRDAVAEFKERAAQVAEQHFIYGHAVAGPHFAAHLAKQIRELE